MLDSRFAFLAMSTVTASTFDRTTVVVRVLEVSAAYLAVILAYVGCGGEDLVASFDEKT